jgi:alkylated DNA repair dioxygenase AlkB
MMNLLGLLQEEYGVAFNGLLINRYRDGTNYVSPHGDNEKGLDQSAGVVIVSWGAKRLFRLRENAPTQRPADPIVFKGVETRAYYALQMAGERFQKDLKHEVPQQKRVTGERVSITARLHLPAYEGMLAKIRARLEQQQVQQAGTKRPREEDAE